MEVKHERRKNGIIKKNWKSDDESHVSNEADWENEHKWIYVNIWCYLPNEKIWKNKKLWDGTDTCCVGREKHLKSSIKFRSRWEKKHEKDQRLRSKLKL